MDSITIDNWKFRINSVSEDFHACYVQIWQAILQVKMLQKEIKYDVDAIDDLGAVYFADYHDIRGMYVCREFILETLEKHLNSAVQLMTIEYLKAQQTKGESGQ